MIIIPNGIYFVERWRTEMKTTAKEWLALRRIERFMLIHLACVKTQTKGR